MGTSGSGCPRSQPHPLTWLWFSFHIWEGGAREEQSLTVQSLTVGAGHRSPGKQGGEETATLKSKRGGGRKETHTQTETQRQRDTVRRQMNALSLGAVVISQWVTLSKLDPQQGKKTTKQAKWPGWLSQSRPGDRTSSPGGPETFSFSCNLSPK